jgi:hypothetical protein
MNDPIVDEVRRVRDAHAARFAYDLDAIFREIKEQERKTGLQFVRGEARQAGSHGQPRPVRGSGPVSPDSDAFEPASAT